MHREVFLLGTQWFFPDGISTITTIVFAGFFLVLLRPSKLGRLEPPSSIV